MQIDLPNSLNMISNQTLKVASPNKNRISIIVGLARTKFVAPLPEEISRISSSASCSCLPWLFGSAVVTRHTIYIKVRFMILGIVLEGNVHSSKRQGLPAARQASAWALIQAAVSVLAIPPIDNSLASIISKTRIIHTRSWIPMISPKIKSLNLQILNKIGPLASPIRIR
jgi:hypothetical protein